MRSEYAAALATAAAGVSLCEPLFAESVAESPPQATAPPASSTAAHVVLITLRGTHPRDEILTIPPGIKVAGSRQGCERIPACVL
ncbi:hypothetical protein GCM10010129_47730 [Streptomyces fumigatiscleroticus]|nr:hypothetical protein GCM10010129_47730 [Streptomyces fumigatiscleroticus]